MFHVKHNDKAYIQDCERICWMSINESRFPQLSCPLIANDVNLMVITVTAKVLEQLLLEQLLTKELRDSAAAK